LDNKYITETCGYGHIQILKLFLTFRSNHLDKSDCLLKASENGHIKIVELFMGICTFDSSLLDYCFRQACDHGHYKIVKLLLVVGVNIQAIMVLLKLLNC
jgi:hypothetical protein